MYFTDIFKIKIYFRIYQQTLPIIDLFFVSKQTSMRSRVTFHATTMHKKQKQMPKWQ